MATELGLVGHPVSRLPSNKPSNKPSEKPDPKPQAHLFHSPLGRCGLAWNAEGLCKFWLPKASETGASETKLRAAFLADELKLVERPPPWVLSLEGRIQAHLQGPNDELGFRDVPVDLRNATSFQQKIYREARRVAPGHTTTYGALAQRCNSPGAAQAVGQALGRNPIPLIIPCHRVLATGGDLGGFNAYGTISTKLRLLSLERADLSQVAQAGIRAIRRVDPRLGTVIAKATRFPLADRQKARGQPFAALAKSIIYQQVSTQAGSTIFGRLLNVVGSSLSPESILATPMEELRGAGVSGRKATYLKDLAQDVTSGRIPLGLVSHLDDEAAIQLLSQIKGIGRWSAQMFLMFHLGRLNVLPVDDLGLRKGAQQVYGLSDLPSAKGLEELARPWIPFRSVGSWYLWRAL